MPPSWWPSLEFLIRRALLPPSDDEDSSLLGRMRLPPPPSSWWPSLWLLTRRELPLPSDEEDSSLLGMMRLPRFVSLLLPATAEGSRESNCSCFISLLSCVCAYVNVCLFCLGIMDDDDGDRRKKQQKARSKEQEEEDLLQLVLDGRGEGERHDVAQLDVVKLLDPQGRNVGHINDKVMRLTFDPTLVLLLALV